MGDFDTDGNNDLAIADLVADAVFVMLNPNGDGGLTDPILVEDLAIPFGITTADLNNDGRLDLAITLLGNDSLVILLGDGKGGFIAESLRTTISEPRNLVAADFDGDGNLDLAIAGSGLGNSGVAVHSGAGDGSFGAEFQIFSGDVANGIAQGDVNGDGIVDLAVADLSLGAFVLVGVGNGTFMPAESISGVGSAFEVLLVDLNQDGLDDTVSLNPFELELITNTSELIQFSEPSVFAVANGVDAGFGVSGEPTGLAYGDLNGDRLPDVVSSIRAQEFNGGVSVSLNQFDSFIILGDLNGDGAVDLLDVAPFVQALSDSLFVPEADINGDGAVNLLDVRPFVDLLSGQT